MSRPAIHQFRRRKRLPEPTTRAAWGFAVALVVLLAGCGLGLRAAYAQTPEDEVPRYAPSSRSSRPAVAQWRELVAAYPWDVETALRVIACESDGDAEAVNPWSGAAGLFQLYRWGGLARRLFGTADVLLPWVNVGTAYALWADSGGTFRWHWSASRGCWS